MIESKTAKILIIDDLPDNVTLLKNFLELRGGYRTFSANSGPEGVEIARNNPVDLILLDVSMPRMDGYQVCELLKGDPQTAEIPVLFISALKDNKDIIKGFKAGAVDYITKPFMVDEVLMRVRTHLTLASLRKDLQTQVVELDAYAHTVAHDLKNPLALITGYSSLLLGDLANMTAAEARPHVESILRASRKMEDIIEGLLLLAKIRNQDEIKFEPLDMGFLLSECCVRLEMVIAEKQGEIRLPDEWPVALGNPKWVEEIWVNLITNALKYGGTPPIVEIGADYPGDGMVRFRVSDNGGGISEQDQALVFTEFTRLEQHAALKGHGIGLSIVLRIVTRLGGTVAVESTVGEGSTFYFTLPAYE